MIPNFALRDVQHYLMEAMTVLYETDKNDEYAQMLAGNIVMIWEAIDIEILERSMLS